MREIDQLLEQAFVLHEDEFGEADDPDVIYFVQYVVAWLDRTDRMKFCLPEEDQSPPPGGVKTLIAFHRESLRRLRAAFPEVFDGKATEL